MVDPDGYLERGRGQGGGGVAGRAAVGQPGGEGEDAAEAVRALERGGEGDGAALREPSLMNSKDGKSLREARGTGHRAQGGPARSPRGNRAQTALGQQGS